MGSLLCHPICTYDDEPYNQQNKIFSLALLADVPRYIKGAKTTAELQSKAQKKANEVLADPRIIGLIGNWKIVWGFQIFQKELSSTSSIADNAVFVAQNNNTKEFVVSIAGTNPISKIDWCTEDFKLNPPVAWNFNEENVTPTGNIAKGTFVGLDIVLNKLKDNGKSLSQFFSHQIVESGQPLKITVTGHSLGGTLSPPVALALLNTQHIWDPKSSAQIHVQPSAGLTSGDKVWRDYYDSKLGCRTNRLWNKLDVAPRCWNITMLKTIPELYANAGLPNSVSTVVKAFINCNVKHSITFTNTSGTGFEQICPNTPPLPGSKIITKSTTVEEYITLLETLVFHKVIDNLLEVPEDVSALMKEKVSNEIKKLNKESNKSKEADMNSIINTLNQEGITKIHLSVLQNLMNFYLQAIKQHTTAYYSLLGTESFVKYANLGNK